MGRLRRFWQMIWLDLLLVQQGLRPVWFDGTIEGRAAAVAHLNKEG